MNLLVLGASGLLGGQVLRQAQLNGARVTGTYWTTPPQSTGAEWLQLDVRDPGMVRALLAQTRPDVVIDAAYRQDDWATTAEGPANIAKAAGAVGARLVFVSSDAVFSGRGSPYTETAAPDPVTRYGAAKVAAEVAVQELAPSAVVVRTSLIITDTGASAHEQRAASAAAGAGGALFVDDIRCPVHVDDLASALLELAASDRSGVHHVAGPDAVSRYELGRLIAVRDGLDPEKIPRAHRSDLGPAEPLDVRLDCRATLSGLRSRVRGARTFLAAQS
ncbi:sugar nucleotide-binding protein [Quadrisphaera oryzae]|uniref:sugar nucleotide-binding protein n=1 Tax=Quadrisphaera TaxID=317661 RepID=UPI0016483124|nr:sugar nucleotide-binding protein [Quadrisphaera sp. RL12-1S]MBC3764194.1 sugar nucleotide-binding protein [Quadrisphaera sp. RL12-1S]